MRCKKIFAVVFVFLLSSYLYAVQKEIRFNKITFSYRNVSAEKTTISGLDQSKLSSVGKVKGWGMIEVVYSTDPDWADDVEIKYNVLMKDKEAKSSVMLAGSVAYIHVQKGKGHISDFYLPPQAAIRYGGVSKIHAEIWYKGVLQDSIDWPDKGGKKEWWTAVKPIYGSLFNRYYTPFEHEAQMKEEVIKI